MPAALMWLVNAAAFVRRLARAMVQRTGDLVWLATKPRLLMAYSSVWATEYRLSPYRPRASFSTILGLQVSGQTADELVYGETPVRTAARLFKAAGLGPQHSLLDIGAGRGRALLAARGLGASARGIELASEHVTAVESILSEVDVALSCEDGSTADLHATHVYIAWTGFAPNTRRRLVQRCAELAAGTIVITPSYPVEHPAFVQRAHLRGSYTWGSERVFIAERIAGLLDERDRDERDAERHSQPRNQP